MSVNLNTPQELRIYSLLHNANSWLTAPGLFHFPLLRLLVAGLLLASPTTNAQPNITNLQLSKSANEFTVLSGTGFGQFDGKVLSWDHFDDKPPASPLHKALPIEGYSWSSEGSAQAFIDQQFSVSGGQSVKLNWNLGKAAFFGWKEKDFYNRLYINYWRRVDGVPSSGHHQQLQLFGKIKAPQLSLGNNSNQCWQLEGKLAQPSKTTTNISQDCITQTANKFQHWELWIDLQRSSINVWLDNQSIASTKTLSNTTDGFNEVKLGYEAEDIETGNSWFDDVYIANTQARVEACNAPEYAQCTRRYLQYVAANNWIDNEIRFRLHNLRALRGEPIYLYVIDSRGQISNGIAIARPVIKAN